MDGVSVPEIKMEKVETRNVRGNSTCVCWMQEVNFRRVKDAIGFSTQQGSDLQAGKYRMVNTARELFIYQGKFNADFYDNKYANHNF